MLPPTYKLPAIPAPPVTFNAPVDDDVETVLSVTLTIPVAVIVPLPNVVFAVAFPTIKPVNVPKLVMLPCDAPVTVPA